MPVKDGELGNKGNLERFKPEAAKFPETVFPKK